MSHICRLSRRLLVGVLLLAGLAQAETPVKTVVADVVYRADGAPASGQALISWPAFTAADGSTVAAGTKGVTLGPGGTFSAELVPNAGATPPGTVYTVVFQLGDSVRTEYWSVGTASPTTIAAVRTTLGASASATQMATRQYVDNAVANRANDTSVVHVSGAETIAGVKEFSLSPVVPDPMGPSDAVNKEYVDSLVGTVGAGSYVSKTGDSMSGPLTLPADPTGPNHAATKHYVDSGLTGKADLVLGKIPATEMGSGSADANMCLRGDGTWGGCGTGLTAGMQAVKYATDFAWSKTAAADLGTPGTKTVTLSSCPGGVVASQSEYYVYVSGTGIAEAVKVTGGTCNGDGVSGTLQFTTTNAHPVGYTIGSASGGLQEAIIAAQITPTNPTGSQQAGKVIVPPGELRAYAKVSIRASNMTVEFSGSILECYMNDVCLFVGSATDANAFQDITIINPRGRPMVVGGQKPFIEVNAQKTRLFNVATRAAATGATFGSYVQVDNDQAFLLDGLETTLGASGSNYGVRCDATVCNPVIYAPGPFASNAAVGWLKHLNISMQCQGNGISWDSGNTLRVSDSVIQGYAQYGVRGGTRRGGYGGFELDNVYEEVGACANPTGAIGQAGVIAQGATVKVQGGEAPAGAFPQFANTGSTEYRYYVVAHHATYGVAVPLYAGKAMTSGAGNIVVTTPDIAGASSFDLLRVPAITSGPEQAPHNGICDGASGHASCAVITNVSRTSTCSNGICTFTDTQAALQPYTVASTTYYPMLDFWPGNLVLGANQDSSNMLNVATAEMDKIGNGIVALQGSGAPAVSALMCPALSSWSSLWANCLGQSYPPSTFYEQGALVLAVKPNADGGGKLNLKGRLNFSSLGTAPGHIITLSDSNFQKTIATANNRPTNDANDAFIGYDQGDGLPSNIGISLGAPKSVSQYIANVGDGTNWKERLTSTLKEFKTDVKINGNLTVTGTCTGCGGGSSGSVTSVFGRTGVVTAQSGDYSVAQVTGAEATANKGAANGYASLDSGGKIPAAQIPSLSESQITGLASDLAAKLGSTGPQTFTGDLTLTGKLKADSFESTGSGPWAVEGSYGTMTVSAVNKSKLGFGANGKLSVSENGGAVTEVAKKTPQEFTYTLFDPNNPLTIALQVPSIYVNRAAALHVVEVYCEIDAGTATINLQTSGANILSSDLACTTVGATSSSFAAGKDAIVVGQKINHVISSIGSGVHRMNVVAKYVVD